MSPVKLQPTKKPALNIHRFTPANRLNKLKRATNQRNKEQLIHLNDEDDEDEGADTDKNSKEYLESLINRIYFQLSSLENSDGTKTSEEYLPLLTSSSEVDLQLHAFIGLLLKNFVLNWYDRITDDYSNEFLIELIFTVAHITRNLQERLQKINYKNLILDDLFVICHLHLENYRKLQKYVGSNLIGTKSTGDIRQQMCELFQMFEPHLAITNQQLYLNALSYNLLQRTLPNDNFNSELTRTILINIVSEFVLKLSVDKLSETYLIWEIIGKICDSILIASAAKGNERSSVTTTTSTRSMSDVVSKISHTIAYTTSTLSSRQLLQDEAPILSFHIWSFLSDFVNFTFKFPLFTMLFTILNKFLFNSSKLNQVLRNLINNFLFKFLINEKFIINILSISRSILFPQDDIFHLEPRFIPTTEEEIDALMLETKLKILSVFDNFKYLKMLVYYKDEQLLNVETSNFLESFRNKEINKHLVLMILDLLFLRLFPDMADE